VSSINGVLIVDLVQILMKQRHILGQVTQPLIGLHRKLIDILGEIEHFIVDAFQSFAENN
jgi:hypothetical protein